MQVIGKDRTGAPIAIERGLFATTWYRGKRRRGPLSTAFLGDFTASGDSIGGGLATVTGDAGGGGFDWSSVFTSLTPVFQGVGARISGGYPYPTQPGQGPYLVAPGPTASASISPMLLLGGVAIAAVMLLKK